MAMENYNNAILTNAILSMVENRKKYYKKCKKVLNCVCSITTEKLLQEVTYPTVQDLCERSNQIGKENIQSMDFGTDGKEKILKIRNTASELVDNFDIFENMILKSH